MVSVVYVVSASDSKERTSMALNILLGRSVLLTHSLKPKGRKEAYPNVPDTRF